MKAPPQEMASAKVTRCRHMYHAICLRKWLYMQDSCPMCHEKLYQVTRMDSAVSAKTTSPLGQ